MALAVLSPAAAQAQQGPSDVPSEDLGRDDGSSEEPGGAEPAEVPFTEEQRSEQARALFAEGVGHSQAQAWSEAAASFEAALELRDAPPIRYNLAAAYVELGRYRDAREQLDAVEADPETAPNIAALSTELADRMRTEAGRLSVERPAELAGAAVSLDAEPLDERWIEREIPVRPGSHVITAAEDDREVARAEVSVAAGEHTHVVLGFGNTSGPEHGPTSATPLYEDWIFWAAVGGGALVLTIVIAGIAAAASGGDTAPINGNFMPGVITW